LRELVDLKRRFNALLLLDEAHAVGVIGPNGRGLAAEEKVGREIDVHMGTLSKALGSSGGYIAGSRSLIDWLINRARSFIFSTAPPAALAAAAIAAIEFVRSPEGDERRRILWRNIELLRKELASPSEPPRLARSQSAIFPWVVGEEQAAVDMSSALAREGFLVPAIRYPTVAKGSARLRIAVTAMHDETQIRSVAESIRRVSPKTG
jgi:7-keto-8-aminopelargonate synthetase-like enzyme